MDATLRLFENYFNIIIDNGRNILYRSTMSKKRSKIPSGAVVMPLRVPADMQKQIRTLSDRSRLSDADIMRMAIDRGLTAVEKMFAQPEETAA